MFLISSPPWNNWFFQRRISHIRKVFPLPDGPTTRWVAPGMKRRSLHPSIFFFTACVWFFFPSFLILFFSLSLPLHSFLLSSTCPKPNFFLFPKLPAAAIPALHTRARSDIHIKLLQFPLSTLELAPTSTQKPTSTFCALPITHTMDNTFYTTHTLNIPHKSPHLFQKAIPYPQA